MKNLVRKIIKRQGLDNNTNKFVYVGTGPGRRYGRMMEDEKGFYVRHYTGDVLKRIKTGDILEICRTHKQVYRVVLD